MNRKDIIRKYKESPPPAGVYRVRNNVNGKSFLGSAPNLSGKLNSQRFQLELGSHRHRELQKDWNEFGATAFTFEILDQLEPSDEPDYNPAEDLRVLLDMWKDKLKSAGEILYH
ncbi:GIY-YIG nuclease family protein [candidate division KSB1 bacterium]|nr:GIY-YIG nuclease family protein [candidate division KSB1 bacterium]